MRSMRPKAEEELSEPTDFEIGRSLYKDRANATFGVYLLALLFRLSSQFHRSLPAVRLITRWYSS